MVDVDTVRAKGSELSSGPGDSRNRVRGEGGEIPGAGGLRSREGVAELSRYQTGAQKSGLSE